MQYPVSLLVVLMMLVEGCSTHNPKVINSQKMFEEPSIARRSGEVYRLFWVANRQHPIAIILSDSVGSAPKIELKSNDGYATYTRGTLDKHVEENISLKEFQDFQMEFEGFSELISDDDRDVTGPNDDDTILICLHASSYSIEIKSRTISHYISRSACADSFETDMEYVAPFMTIAHRYFEKELSSLVQFADYPVVQKSIPSAN